MPLKLFDGPPPIIAALHLPDFARSRFRSMSWFQDYVLTNVGIFVDAGIPWVKLQDQTRTSDTAAPDTLTMMAALGCLIRNEFPSLGLGIIVEAHDARAALSIAHAVNADFVRLKVFVGGAMTAAGPKSALAASATGYRTQINREDIALVADVHDRTARPLSDEPQPFAAQWAAKSGADGLIITGSSFDDTRQRVEAVRQTVPALPILVGGGVTVSNVKAALSFSDGLVVSSALMRKDADPDDLAQWDPDLCQRFMEAAKQT
ncbi:MAG: BtpA/SgcQ family protein [Pseudomonadota bacterium]